MAILTKKFSEFAVGGDLNPNDTTVGLTGGINTKYANPAPLLAPGTTAQRPTPDPIIYNRLRFNTDANSFEYYSSITLAWTEIGDSGDIGDIPALIYKAYAPATSAINLGLLTSGVLSQTVAAGIATIDATYSPRIDNIVDAQSETVLSLSSAGVGSVNYLDIINQPTAQNPTLSAKGTDPDISVQINPKGTGSVYLGTASSLAPLVITSGPSGQHTTTFVLPTTAANRTVTFQDDDGTVAFLSDVPGTVVSSAQGTDLQVFVNGTFGSPVTGAVTLTLPQDIDHTSSPRFTNLTLEGTQIFDVDNNIILYLSKTVLAVNTMYVGNSAAGDSPEVGSVGADNDLGIIYRTKNAGVHQFISQNTTVPIIWNTGTSAQHITEWAVADTAQDRTITLPDMSGTMTLLGNAVIGTGSFVLQTAPNIINPTISDPNGNPVLAVDVTGVPGTAVNYLSIGNADTGISPRIEAIGTDTNAGIDLFGKNTGPISINSTNTTVPFLINSGTLYQHATNFSFANTANSRTVTFQDADGTLCMDTSSSGSITTSPPASASSSLALGAAYQNVLGYDIVLTVYLAVIAATTDNVSLGVGPSNTPTQQNIVTGLIVSTGTTYIPVTIYLPNNYYALLSVGGSVTAAIVGQQAMPV